MFDVQFEFFVSGATAEMDDSHPRTLIPAMCKEMYEKGWATGSGGGFSVKYEYAFNLIVFFAVSSPKQCSVPTYDFFLVCAQQQ